jgi:Uma2 family endonuclease
MRHYLSRLTTARIVGTGYYGASRPQGATVEVTGDMEAQIMAVPDRAATAEAELADIERLWQSLDLPGHRVELIDGQIVVSPTASRWHADVITELIDQLAPVKRRGWKRYTNLTAHMPATRNRFVPDLMVAPANAPGFGENELLAPGVLLAAEVISPSSRRDDRQVKHRAYAQARIPLYLVVDPYASPPSVTLYCEPGRGGYEREQTASAGQPLRLPEPFGIDLDTRRLLG